MEKKLEWSLNKRCNLNQLIKGWSDDNQTDVTQYR